MLLTSVFAAPFCAADGFGENRTYDAVVSGKHCYEYQEINCRFKVGKSLDFEIVGIGVRDTGITFMKVDYDGDFYASYGIQHGVVIVKPGRLSLRPGTWDIAFVSPQNGKAYRTWQECQQRL